MKASELKAGQWYKFISKANGNTTWYVQPAVNGNTRPSKAFIGDFNDGKGKSYEKFGNIYHNDRNFELADMEEINPFLPKEEKIIVNYSIY